MDAMSYDSAEDAALFLSHLMTGLLREALIVLELPSESTTAFLKTLKEDLDPGLLITPTPIGAELFWWAYGRGDLPISRFFDETVECLPLDELSVGDGAFAVPQQTEDDLAATARQLETTYELVMKLMEMKRQEPDHEHTPEIVDVRAIFSGDHENRREGVALKRRCGCGFESVEEDWDSTAANFQKY
jgi:hypothetical protein